MDRSTPWGLVLLLWCAGLLAAAQFARMALSLDALAQIYPGWPVAYLVSGVAVIGLVFGVTGGGIVARLGAARVTRWALLISAGAVLLQVALPSFVALMGLRVIEGAGHLALVIALPTLLAALATSKDRSVVMGLWSAFFGVGFALTALVSHVVPAPKALFALHGVSFAVMAFVLWGLPEVEAPEQRPMLWNPFEVYRRARIIAPGVGHGLYASMFIGLMTFLPGALNQMWLAPVLPLVGVGGALLAGILARCIAPSVIVVGGFGVVSLLFCAVHFSSGTYALSLSVIAVFVSGFIAGAGFAAVPWLSTTLENRALSNGVMAQLGNLGTFMSVPLFAALGPDGLALGTGVLAAMSAVVTALIYSMSTKEH